MQRVPPNLTTPIREGFGRFLQAFHAQLVADTPALVEYAGRDFSRAAAWAPGRMVDSVDDMLNEWRKNGTPGVARPAPYLPIMIAAAGRDYMPSTGDVARQAAEPQYCMLPDDPKERVFTIRAAMTDLRVQVAIIAQDEPSARSIALQLQLWCSAMRNRTFQAIYTLAGMPQPWPVQLEAPEIASTNVPTEAKNIVILTADFNLRCAIPLLGAPREGSDEADGKGTDPVFDPDGFALLAEVHGEARGDSGGSPFVWTDASQFPAVRNPVA